jgi:hypothetical protein
MFANIGKAFRTAVKVGDRIKSAFKIGEKAYSMVSNGIKHPTSVNAGSVLGLISETAKAGAGVLKSADDLGKATMGNAYEYTPAALVTGTGANAMSEASTLARFGQRAANHGSVSKKEWEQLGNKALRTGAEFGIAYAGGKIAGKLVGKSVVGKAVVGHMIGDGITSQSLDKV